MLRFASLMLAAVGPPSLTFLRFALLTSCLLYFSQSGVPAPQPVWATREGGRCGNCANNRCTSLLTGIFVFFSRVRRFQIVAGGLRRRNEESEGCACSWSERGRISRATLHAHHQRRR